MKSLNIIALQKKQAESILHTYPSSEPVLVNDNLRSLAEAVKQYRHYQKLYFAKRKKGEFYKDEEHFMMKYQDKIDLLLSTMDLK
ncbi:hypothetical protein GXP67_21100 [Rhodocytophaga rosea]|uniref:Uncharacterized protein n=1 Tax=Rhodocytophaga rosea TaxID=2704465 RepID=A0A6C0GLR7_9BACT|nr:hypothetical protein [Rhodocytophaga rosea]QHT68968.1 hypothetical protein GXP67_21100 [Rhodocytophaga rosea]